MWRVHEQSNTRIRTIHEKACHSNSNFETRKNALHALSDIAEGFFAYQEATIGGLLIPEYADDHAIKDAIKVIINVLSPEERERVCQSPWGEFSEWWRGLQDLYQKGGKHKGYGDFENFAKDRQEPDESLFEKLPEVVLPLSIGAITV